MTTFRGGYYMDGGVSSFIPQPQHVDYTVKVGWGGGMGRRVRGCRRPCVGLPEALGALARCRPCLPPACPPARPPRRPQVCCFPTRHLAFVQSRARNLARVSALLEVDISPDTFSAWPREYGGWLGELSKWQELVQWGLVPTRDDMLQFLMDRGYEDAVEWAAVQGLLGGAGGGGGNGGNGGEVRLAGMGAGGPAGGPAAPGAAAAAAARQRPPAV